MNFGVAMDRTIFRLRPYQSIYFLFVLSRFDISVLIVLNQPSIHAFVAIWGDYLNIARSRALQGERFMSRFVRSIVCNSGSLSFHRAISRNLLALAGGWLAFVLLSASPARAQVSAAISGRVTDPAGATVSDAAVTAKNVETGETRSTITDAVGHYWVPSLAVGEYELHFTKAGFQEYAQGGIHLVVGQEASVDVALRLGQVTEQVKVNADAPIISVTAADISGVVDEQQVKDLPLNGRSYDQLMTLNPGVVIFTSEKTGGIGVSNSTAANMFSVAGNRPQQNMFLLNGIEYTGAAENNMQPGGVSGQMLGVDAIREFNMLSDTYGAEYGKHPGAQVTIVTQSGTNQWHGSIFEYLRNNALDEPNFFDPGSAPPFRRNQFGGSMGGPIQKDKTFVFANYEGFRQSLHQTSKSFVPDASRARRHVGGAGFGMSGGKTGSLRR